MDDVFIKIDEKLYKRVQELTTTDYELKGDYVSVLSLVCMIEDLICEVEHYKEEYEDLERDLQDNYKQITPAEMYDISDKDFM